jgi:hypothetical protein
MRDKEPGAKDGEILRLEVDTEKTSGTRIYPVEKKRKER